MKSTRALLTREYVWRIALSVLGIEILIFLLPTSGKVEGVASGYWDGVGQRLTSGGFWAIAVLSGIGMAALFTALLAFSGYLTRFVKPPSKSGRSSGETRRE